MQIPWQIPAGKRVHWAHSARFGESAFRERFNAKHPPFILMSVFRNVFEIPQAHSSTSHWTNIRPKSQKKKNLGCVVFVRFTRSQISHMFINALRFNTHTHPHNFHWKYTHTCDVSVAVCVRVKEERISPVSIGLFRKQTSKSLEIPKPGAPLLPRTYETRLNAFQRTFITILHETKCVLLCLSVWR